MIEKFFEFLRENGVYDRYMERSAEYLGIHKNYIVDVVTDRLKDTSADIYVGCMFLWDGTDEGRNYWLYLANKWNRSL